MKIFLKLLGFMAIFLCSFLKSEAKGRDVVIFLKDSTEVKGELLAVRDSLVAIAVEPINSDEDIAAYPERVKVIKLAQFYRLLIIEDDVRFTSAFIGAGAGAMAGLFISQRSFPFGTNDKYTPVFGSALVCFLAGWTMGNIISKDGEKFTFMTEDTTKQHKIKVQKSGFQETFFIQDILPLLKEHARFKESEPSYLRDAIDNLLKETK